jgi:sortase A
MVGGAAFLGYYYHIEHTAARAQRDAREWLNRTVRAPKSVPSPPTPARRRLNHGEVVGRLNIPRLHLSVMVFEGDDTAILKLGAGHIPGTALPGENGNLGIAAHRDTYFRPLRLIRPNDVMEFTTPQGTSRYTVTDTEIVTPSDIAVLAKVPGRDLTLVTCYPFYYVGSAPERWIVHARKIA